MRYRFLVLLFQAAAALGAVSSALALDLVTTNQPQTAIVIPDNATQVVRFAAEELQYHIKRASGAELPIVNESQNSTAEGLVYLGPCKKTAQTNIVSEQLPPNGFVIKLIDSNLFLVGDDSAGQPMGILHNNRTRVGTLFAVYEFLEKHLDVRWLWPGKLGEVIPEQADIRVEAWDQIGGPRLIHTRWRDGSFIVASTLGWTNPAARSKYLHDQSVWLRRHRFAMGANLDMHHAFTSWYEKYGKTHPEYFNLLPDNTRRSDPTYGNGASRLIGMCVAEPRLHKAIVEHWLQTRTPKKTYIDASENDTNGKCICAKCLAWDVPTTDLEFPFNERVDHARKAFTAGDKNWYRTLGPLSDRYARYFLAVQQEARKVDPDTTVMGYAYTNHKDAPLETKLNDHILIGIVPGIGWPMTDEKREGFRKQWSGWSDTGARLMLRPNYMLNGHNMPLFLARKIGEDFSFAASHGLIATDFDSLTGQWSTQGPNLYVLARLHSRPDFSVDQVLDEYYAGFGSAKASVQAYFGHWEKVADSFTEKPSGIHWSTFYRNAHLVFTPQAMALGRQLLDEARKAAEGDATAQQRVLFLSDGLKNAELTLAAQAAYRNYREQGDIASYRAAIQQLDSHRHGAEQDSIANLGYLAWAEQRTWNRELLQQKPLHSEPLISQDANLILNGNFEQQDVGWKKSTMNGQFEFALDDSHVHNGATSGRLTCTQLGADQSQQNRTRSWGRWLQPKIAVKKGKTYRLRIRVKTNKTFNGRASIWVTGTTKGTMTTELLNTENAWRLATLEQIVPEGEQVGVYLNLMDGKGSVWFDDVELAEMKEP